MAWGNQLVPRAWLCRPWRSHATSCNPRPHVVCGRSKLRFEPPCESRSSPGSKHKPRWSKDHRGFLLRFAWGNPPVYLGFPCHPSSMALRFNFVHPQPSHPWLGVRRARIGRCSRASCPLRHKAHIATHPAPLVVQGTHPVCPLEAMLQAPGQNRQALNITL